MPNYGTPPKKETPQFRFTVFTFQGIRNFHLLGPYYVVPALDASIHLTSFSLHNTEGCALEFFP